MSSQDFVIQEVKDAVFDWASDNFGDNAVVWEKGNGTRLGKPFVSLDLKSGPQFGGMDHIRDGARLCGDRQLQVTVNIFSDNDPWQMAMDLRTSLQLPTVVDFFDAKNIGIGEIMAVNDLSQLIDDTNWEQRAQFDFFLIVASDKAFDAGSIEQVEIKNNFGR